MKSPFGRKPAVRLDEPVSPLTIRLRHVDRELTVLSQQQPRTVAVWQALDFWLDRRLKARGGAP